MLTPAEHPTADRGHGHGRLQDGLEAVPRRSIRQAAATPGTLSSFFRGRKGSETDTNSVFILQLMKEHLGLMPPQGTHPHGEEAKVS